MSHELMEIPVISRNSETGGTGELWAPQFRLTEFHSGPGPDFCFPLYIVSLHTCLECTTEADSEHMPSRTVTKSAWGFQKRGSSIRNCWQKQNTVNISPSFYTLCRTVLAVLQNVWADGNRGGKKCQRRKTGVPAARTEHLIWRTTKSQHTPLPASTDH